jgi:hypothetical protein
MRLPHVVRRIARMDIDRHTQSLGPRHDRFEPGIIEEAGPFTRSPWNWKEAIELAIRSDRCRPHRSHQVVDGGATV